VPLPVDDAGQDQVQATAGVHLLPQLAGVNPAPPPVKDIPGQGVELLDFEQAAPDAAAQLRLLDLLLVRYCRSYPKGMVLRVSLGQLGRYFLAFELNDSRIPRGN
jgi:hypothetical protein